MFIIYDGSLYRYIEEDKGHFEIVTFDGSKADDSFTLDGSTYYKEIFEDDKLIQDIYSMNFFLEWDSQLKDVNTIWEITPSDFLSKEQIQLEFGNGRLPGWKVVENTVCTRYISINECKSFSATYIYTTKDGEFLAQPIIVKKDLSCEEFEQLICQHKTRSI